jgi:hypothetical protein
VRARCLLRTRKERSKDECKKEVAHQFGFSDLGLDWSCCLSVLSGDGVGATCCHILPPGVFPQ